MAMQDHWNDWAGVGGHLSRHGVDFQPVDDHLRLFPCSTDIPILWDCHWEFLGGVGQLH